MAKDKIILKPQVPKEHYFKNYDTKERFISYWYQIDEVLRTKPEKVLEVGIGNKTVSNYLKNMGIDVKTVDIDPTLGPDSVCSVIELSEHFGKASFDTVLCAEVLEHLPFDCFESALREMKYVAKNFVIISLPYLGIKLYFKFKLPIFKEKQLLLSFPNYRDHKFDGEHYWEIGKKGYSIKSILTILSKSFKIHHNYLISDNPYHMMFVLDANNKN